MGGRCVWAVWAGGQYLFLALRGQFAVFSRERLHDSALEGERIMRMRLNFRRVAWVSGLLLCATAAQGAPITWSGVQNISGPGGTTVTTTPVATGGLGPGSGVTITNGSNDVNTQGTQVFGVNFSGTNGSTYPYTTTIGGQLFDSFRDTTSYAVTYNATGVTNSYPAFGAPGAAAQSYGQYNSAGVGPNPDYTLSNAAYSNSAAGTITLGGLTVGRKYLLQFWVSDPRGGNLSSRIETITGSGSDVNVPTLAYGGAGSTDGQWVTGTFTADSVAETLTLAAGNANAASGDGGSAQVNLLQLRDVTAAPEPGALALLGLMSIGLLGRRRRLL
jgi:hypothetical protein